MAHKNNILHIENSYEDRWRDGPVAEMLLLLTEDPSSGPRRHFKANTVIPASRRPWDSVPKSLVGEIRALPRDPVSVNMKDSFGGAMPSLIMALSIHVSHNSPTLHELKSPNRGHDAGHLSIVLGYMI